MRDGVDIDTNPTDFEGGAIQLTQKTLPLANKVFAKAGWRLNVSNRTWIK